MTPTSAGPAYPKLALVPNPAVADGLAPALGYARISEDRTGDAAGVERQEREMREYAATKRLRLVAMYVDNDISATSGRVRPQFERLLEDLAALPKRERIIVAWAQDRLLRQTRDLERVIELDATAHFRNAGSADLDLATPAGRAVARTVAAWAQFETEQKAERQRSRNRQAAEAGKPYWTRRPFGYELDGTPREDEADAIRWAAATILEGGSIREIAREWARRGLVTYAGNPWTPVQVRKVLVGERIAAFRTYGGQTVRGTWVPILPEDSWRQLTATLTAPERGSGPPRGRVATTLLGGIATCGRCGGVMHGHRVNGEPYLRCDGPARDLYRKSAPINALVAEAVIARLSLPDAAAAHQRTTEPDGVDLAGEAQRVRGRLADLAAAYAADALTLDQLTTASAALKARLADIETRMVRTTAGTALLAFAGAEDVRGTWEALALERQRAVIKVLLDAVILLPARGRFSPTSVDLVWRGATPPSDSEPPAGE